MSHQDDGHDGCSNLPPWRSWVRALAAGWHRRRPRPAGAVQRRPISSAMSISARWRGWSVAWATPAKPMRRRWPRPLQPCPTAHGATWRRSEIIPNSSTRYRRAGGSRATTGRRVAGMSAMSPGLPRPSARSASAFPRRSPARPAFPPTARISSSPRPAAGGRGISALAGRRFAVPGLALATPPRGLRCLHRSHRAVGRIPSRLGIVHHHTGLHWCHAGEFTFCGRRPRHGGRLLPASRPPSSNNCATLGGMLARTVRTGRGDRRRCDHRCTGPRLGRGSRIHGPRRRWNCTSGATGESVAVAHLGRVRSCPCAASRQTARRRQDVAWAKAVVHAPRRRRDHRPRWPTVCRQLAEAWTGAADGGWAALADIPAVPQTIRPRPAVAHRVRRQAADPATAFRLLENRVTAIIATLPSPVS